MPDNWLGLIFALSVAFAGGAGGAEAFRALREWRAGIAGRHKRELRDLGGQLAQAVAERDQFERRWRDAQRREHLAHLWGRRLELLATEYGVPQEKMPVLDFYDD